jgi:MFS family permease
LTLTKTPPESGFGVRFVAPLLVGSMLNPINSSMIATALVPISATYHVSVGTTGWLVAALYVASAIAQPVLGRLADRFGPRRIYLAGLIAVAIAGLGGAWAPNLWTLVVVRVLIGIGTSAAYPSAMALVRAQSQRLNRPVPGNVLSGLTLASLVSAAVGPALGGLLVGLAGWPSIFLVNVPLAIVGLVMTFRWLPVSVSERRTRTSFSLNVPLLVTYGRSALAFVVIYGMLYGFAQWLESSGGFSPAAAGLLMLPITVVATLCTALGGRRRQVRGPLLIGTACMVVGSVALIFVNTGAGIAVLIAVGVLFGIPNGLNPVGNQAALYAQAPADQIGVASGLFRTAQYVGAIASSGILAVVYGSEATDGGLHLLAAIFAGISVLLLAATVFDRTIAKSG